MTTLVVVRKNNTIAIAADSLATCGDTKITAVYDKSPNKIVRYQDTYIALCGAAAHQLVFESALAQHSDLIDFSNKLAIFESFRKLHPLLKENYFLNPKEDEEDPYESSQFNALLANKNGIYSVHALRDVFEYTRFWAEGSGADFALGAMNAVWEQLDSAEAIAKVGIDAGVAFDARTALPMDLYTIEIK